MRVTPKFWLAVAMAIGCIGLASCGGSSGSDGDDGASTPTDPQSEDGGQEPSDDPAEEPAEVSGSILDLEASDWALLASLSDLGMDDVSGPAALVDGTVWMGAGEGIFLIDPETRERTSTVAIPDGNEGYAEMVVTDSSVIVTTGFGGKTMYVIDRETQEVAEPVMLGDGASDGPKTFGLTAVGDRLFAQYSVWDPTAGVDEYSIIEIDPTDGSTIETFPIEVAPGAGSPSIPTGAAGLLWYGSGGGNTGEHALNALDPDSGTTEQIAGITTSDGPQAFESSEGVVVMNTATDSLVIIDPESMETSEIPLTTIGTGESTNYFEHLIVEADAAIVTGDKGGFEVVDLGEKQSLYDVPVVVGGSSDLDGIIVGAEFWVHNGGSFSATSGGEVQAQIGGKES